MNLIRRTILLFCMVALGSDSFSQPVTFISRNLSSWLGNAHAGAMGDVDGDGDLDLVVGQNDRLVWHEFDQNQGDFRGWAEISAPRGAVNYYGVTLADIDGDGDLDLFAELDGIAPTRQGIYYEYIGGTDSFGDEQMLLDGSGASADVDKDGDLDLIFRLSDRNTIGWYENVDGLGTMGPFTTISTVFKGIKAINMGDIDGDGYEDILVAASFSDVIVWFKNQLGDVNSFSTFSSGIPISSSQDGPADATLSDIDGDGDLDVVAASGSDDTVAWYRNEDGQGSFGPAITITDNANGVFRAVPADLDNDGDPDVVTSSLWDQTVGWHENLDGAGQFGPYQEIIAEQGFIFVGDIDLDGDIDIAGAIGNTGQKMGWLENQLIIATDTENDLANQAQNQRLSVYPNPATGSARLSFSVSHSADSKVEVFDLLGRSLSTAYTGFLFGGRHEMELVTDSFPPGLLLVRVTTGHESRTTKLIIAK